MDRFDAISAFVAVADCKGFAAAARKLKLAPSAVTRLIVALEDHLGLRLFQRTTRSVTLTDAGLRYLELGRRILADLAEADALVQSERVHPSGRFTVSAPLTFGRLHVGPLMSAYLAAFPDVIGELSLSDRIVNLIDEGIDLAVRIGHLADSTLTVRKVGETRPIVVASPAYLARAGEPQTPDEIAAHQTIQFVGFGGSADWRFRDKRIAVEPRYVTNSADTALWHAAQDGGLARVFSYQAAELLRAGRLKVVLRTFELPPVPIQLVTPTSRLVSPKVRAFIDLVIETTDWHFADI
ncbi:LysR family transcriptional regulator [Methylovirgula sp. 4M-Z18]|uniref:LysR family transcriptional regulator n=1 Tax=Methylovirgula sp. 4M-Z18 TaxID=2293567 RepID=UPI000E2E7815|nr:LysR family transcriptional regulator [Methylovirgula sp. 4M-Z18]RFB80811.1 LysR family transcriptional regulator [Methylovirgula sp. 4M-Z18]